MVSKSRIINEFGINSTFSEKYSPVGVGTWQEQENKLDLDFFVQGVWFYTLVWIYPSNMGISSNIERGSGRRGRKPSGSTVGMGGIIQGRQRGNGFHTGSILIFHPLKTTHISNTLTAFSTRGQRGTRSDHFFLENLDLKKATGGEGGQACNL